MHYHLAEFCLYRSPRITAPREGIFRFIVYNITVHLSKERLSQSIFHMDIFCYRVEDIKWKKKEKEKKTPYARPTAIILISKYWS